MKIYIENKLNVDKITLNLLDSNYDVLFKEEIKTFLKEIDIDLNKFKYLSFNINDKQSDIIILSKNISKLVLKYNEITKTNDIYLGVYGANDYGKIESYTLEDNKNLFYRLDNSKNINVLLPSDYDNRKKYGVIIMFDSQNIFDKSKVGNYTDKNDPYGGWQVETSLLNIKNLYNQEYIVVGIENADEYREMELTPYIENAKFKKELLDLNDDNLLNGKLDHLGYFINETLLPFIQKKYNVDLNELGIIGSSCGGLASFYLGMKYYDKYKFIFTFTPATGFVKDETLKEFYSKIDFNKNYDKLPYIFYYQGDKGGLEHLLYELNLNFIPLLIKEGYNPELIDEYIEKSAEHNETVWRYGFNYAINKYHEKRGK